MYRNNYAVAHQWKINEQCILLLFLYLFLFIYYILFILLIRREFLRAAPFQE